MRDNQTHPRIVHFIYKGLTKWFKNTYYKWREDNTINTDKFNTKYAFISQMKIGWHNLLCGLLSEELIAVQQSHFTNIESRKGANKWDAKLITKL